jgi:BolA family transcriptional regulator, general stress-responsive regulator
MRSLMPQELTTRTERIRSALAAAFSPGELDIVDESHLHHGHAGAAPGGETHYSVRIRAAAFAGLSRLARHRLVNDALKGEFASGLHALHIDAA